MNDVWIKLLEKMFQLVEEANSPEEKAALVVKKLNIDVVQRLEGNRNIDAELQNLFNSNAVYNDAKYSWTKTTAMALAVCLADVEKVKLFLKYIPDINDSNHFVWGYRQQYSYVHLVASPYSHISSLRFQEQDIETILNNREKILKELSFKGANFNWVPDGCGYQNPPLAAAYNPGGNYDGFNTSTYSKISSKLIKLLIMYGANPAIIGSSFHFSLKLQVLPFIKSTAKVFVEHKLTGNPSYLMLDPEVKASFSEALTQNMTQLKTLLMCYNRKQQSNGNNALPEELVTPVVDYSLDLDTSDILEKNVTSMAKRHGHKIYN